MRVTLVKISAFFVRSRRMTQRNTFIFFEIAFWPVVGLLSVGLMTRFLRLPGEAVVFVLTGTLALSVVQVCQLDVAYAVLFDVWSKSIKHQFLAPVQPWHVAAGAWLMGVLRGMAVFVLLAVVTRAVFGVDFGGHGWIAAGTFLLGLLLSAAGVGLLVCGLLLLFGLRAEVSAWSGVSLVFLVCGIYYPVSVLPGPLAVLASLVPLTYFLDAFRTGFGFEPVFSHSLARGYVLAVVYVLGGYAAFAGALARARRTGMLLKLSD
jgi:ABC-2 type transport system permease protein